MQKLVTYPKTYKNGDAVLFEDSAEKRIICVKNFFDFMHRVEENFSQIYINITIDENADFDAFETDSKEMIYFWWNYETFCIQAKYFQQYIKNNYNSKTMPYANIIIYNFQREKSWYDFTFIDGSQLDK